MIKRCFTLIILAVMVMPVLQGQQADHQRGNALSYRAELSVNAGNGQFAPYYISANRHGVTTQSTGSQLRLCGWKELDESKKFSWSIGMDAIIGHSKTSDYIKYDSHADSWAQNPQRPPHLWIQQLYGQIKWRSLFITAGLKEHISHMLDHDLSSGDFVESGNARPMPELRAGFIDFQDIPFTHGWLQAQGEVAYGIPTDNNWLRNHFNHFNSFITVNSLYHYKRLLFRTRPECSLSVTVGLQSGAQFNGTQTIYNNGLVSHIKKEPFKLTNLLDMLITRTDGSYYKGNHLGSWDMKARYRLRNGNEVSAYFQWPWEDGSGIGKLNGFDGLWGVEWKKATPGPVSGFVAELLYFMNQSGPIHCDPDDFPGSTFPAHTDGADDYYNNYSYNGYAHYGMSIGSPVFPSPLYNLDGYMRYTDTRLRGFHIGVKGDIFLAGHHIIYRLLGGYREAFGSGYIPRTAPVHDTSMLIEANWHPAKLPALTVNAQFGADRGNIYGNQTGFRLAISYTGALMSRKTAKL